ncbi:MAG: hypothetical protein R3C14_21925 [Caldilineaceae bacterium]
MRDYTKTRQRYLRDPVPVRLGGLAANLARVKSFSAHMENDTLVNSLLDESKHFIEWTAAEAEVDVAAELVDLQLQLVRWQRTWTNIWPDPVKRQEVADTAKRWSDRVLEMSGLLDAD